jgi:hypothetical protein
VEGYGNPAIVLEGRAIGALVDEAAGDALMDFILASAQLDPGNIQVAE